MGKKVYTINGRLYLIDDDTGERLLTKKGGKKLIKFTRGGVNYVASKSFYKNKLLCR